jgi:hypothetical protein
MLLYAPLGAGLFLPRPDVFFMAQKIIENRYIGLSGAAGKWSHGRGAGWKGI